MEVPYGQLIAGHSLEVICCLSYMRTYTHNAYYTCIKFTCVNASESENKVLIDTLYPDFNLSYVS